MLDAQKRATLCKAMGTRVRVVEGVSLFYCARHADEIDAKQAAAAAKRATSNRLNWDDRTAVWVWWDALFIAFEDMSSVADDATRPPSKRHLGRAEARKLFREADRTLRYLISFGEPPAVELGAMPGDPAGSGGSPAH